MSYRGALLAVMTVTSKWLIVAFVIVAFGGSQVDSQPLPNILRWTVNVATVDATTTGPRAQRLFESQAELSLKLTLFNDSQVDLTINGLEFSERVVIHARSEGRDLPIRVQWADVVRPARAASDVSANFLELAPNQGAGWNIRIERADGQPFGDGDYEIDFELTPAVSALMTPAGERWPGRFVSANTFKLTIAEPRNRVDQVDRWAQLALSALLDKRPAEASGLYLKALALAPDDARLLVGLAETYVDQHRFREAIPILERFLPAIGERSSVPLLLTLAYVGVGDEANAARILRRGGRSETDTQREIVRFREVVKRGPIRR